jgi:hypothetical protein
VVEMQRIAVSELSAEGFAPFGLVGLPLADGAHGRATLRSTCRRAGRGFI